jgi:hypothetical protein
MLYIVTAILGLVAGFISANYVNTKRKEELNKVINDLKRKLTLAATRRPSRNYKRNGKKKTASNIIVNKQANLGGKGKAKKAKTTS